MQSQISKMEKNQSLLIHGDDLRGRYSVSEFIRLMPSQLSQSGQNSIFHLIIFCSQDHPIQFNNNKGIAAIKEKIKSALEGLDIFHFPALVQLWMPKTIGTQQPLVTSDLPFGINLLTKGLCLYRTRCLEQKYDLGCEEELGPVERVFRNGVPEFSPYVCCYSSKEFKLRDAAVRCGVNGYMALPVFESAGDQCICVLELITPWDGNYCFTDAIGKVNDAFKAVGLRISDAHSPLCKERISQHDFDLSRIEKGLNAFCHAHCIPFAQTWFTSTGENHNESIMRTSEKGSVMLVKKFSSFQKDCIQFGLKKGQSVVWSTFVSGTSHFCKDVKQLSIDDYPLVLSARKVNLTGSFAVCLQSRSTGNEVYVLEFFLFPYQAFYWKPQTLLNSLLAAVQQNFQSFNVASVQELGADIPLNTIKLDRLDKSLEMSAAQSQPLLRFSQNKGKTIQTQDNLVFLQNNEDMVKAPELKVLRNQSRRQLKDAECMSDVTRHEEKQLCREHSIDRLTKKRKADCSLSHKDVRGFENYNWRTHNRDQARSDLPPDEDTASVSHPAESAPENEGTIMIKASFKEGMIKFPLSLSSGIMDFEKEVTERLHLTSGSFEIKYQKEDNNCILVANDVDLQKLMSDIMSQRKNTVKVLLELTQNQPLESSRGSVGCPVLQITPVQSESIKAPPAPKNEGTIMIKASFKEDMIKFPLSLSSGMMDFEKEVTERLNLTSGSFEIKYQKEDNNCILVANDVDLQKLMSDIMSQRKNTVKVLLELTQNQPLESSRASVGCPVLQITPVQKERIMTIKATYKEETVEFQLSLSSKLIELKKEVMKQFKLSGASFDIKYLAEPNEWFPLTNDHDLHNFVTIMKPQENQTIRLAVEPCTNQIPEEVGTSASPHMPRAMIKQNESLMTIKATYKEVMIKFQLSPSSGLMQLRDAVKKRLNLSGESYEVKYQDVNNNWIYLSRDADLQNHLRAMKSSDRLTVRLHIEPLKT